MLIDKPGVYPALAMSDYLSSPAVSASLVQDCLYRCPRAAWFNSWLNPLFVPDASSAAQNTGSIAHSILLEGNSDCVRAIDPLDYPAEKTGNIPGGWTNTAIRDARDDALRDGKIPVLVGQMSEIEAMVAEARRYIDSLQKAEPAIWALFQPSGGQSELTLAWDDAGTLCRIRPDRIAADHRLICDYKTGGTTAEPDTWGRTQMIRMGYYVSASFYRRGCKAIFGREPDYVYLVQEQEAPYLCSLVGVPPIGYEMGSIQIERGLNIWKDCVSRDRWPAYPARVCYPQFPAYEMLRVEEKETHGPIDWSIYGGVVQA